MGNTLPKQVVRVWVWVPILGIYPAMFKMDSIERDWPLTAEGMFNAVYQMGCIVYLIARAYG